jgi:P pilus assembly chaperone PapD
MLTHNLLNRSSRSLWTGLFGLSLLVLPVMAQQFSVAPMVTITGGQGNSSKGSINVANKGREPLRVRMYAESFTYDAKKGFVFVQADERSAVPYLQFSPREMEIPPGVTRNVRVAVTLPANLPDREYRAAIFVEDLKEQSVGTSSGSTVAIKARVASVFFFSKGSTDADVQVSAAVWDASSQRVNLVMSNKGTRTAYPEVIWKLEKNGKEVAKNTIRGIIVQSQNSREFALKNEGNPMALSSGQYNLSGSIAVAGKRTVPFNIPVIVP